MDEKKNKYEGLTHKEEEAETSESNEQMDINSETEPATELSEEEPEHKRKKTSGSKHQTEDRTAELEQEVAQWNDKYLRLYSEFDNYRKRSIKEKFELGKSAASELITTLLPVLDDFERALDSMETGEDEDKENAHINGITLVYNKLKNILFQQGLERMKVMGEEFSTDFHEAMTKIPAPEPELKGKVVDVIQNGYLLNGKVIRYAKVVVGS